MTDEAQTHDGLVNAVGQSLPSNEKRVPAKVQLLQKEEHYVGKLLKDLKENQEVIAIGPTKGTDDGVLQMQPMMVITEGNFADLLAINLFMACGGLGPKKEEKEVADNTVTNRSIAWSDGDQTNWFQCTAWGDLSKQLAEQPPGTPTIAVGKVTCSAKEDKRFLNYNVDKILYLPKGQKAAPKKAADPDKGRVAAAALGSVDFSL